MTELVSADCYDDSVVQLKTHRQKSHYKNNQLCECATINLKVNSVIDGKHVLFSGNGPLLHAVCCHSVCKNVTLNRLDGDMTSPENFGPA